jgi:hypothetical protein
MSKVQAEADYPNSHLLAIWGLLGPLFFGASLYVASLFPVVPVWLMLAATGCFGSAWLWKRPALGPCIIALCATMCVSMYMYPGIGAIPLTLMGLSFVLSVAVTALGYDEIDGTLGMLAESSYAHVERMAELEHTIEHLQNKHEEALSSNQGLKEQCDQLETQNMETEFRRLQEQQHILQLQEKIAEYDDRADEQLKIVDDTFHEMLLLQEEHQKITLAAQEKSLADENDDHEWEKLLLEMEREQQQLELQYDRDVGELQAFILQLMEMQRIPSASAPLAVEPLPLAKSVEKPLAAKADKNPKTSRKPPPPSEKKAVSLPQPVSLEAETKATAKPATPVKPKKTNVWANAILSRWSTEK